MEYPSILNDVIGPVMRGPSSSHCAAAVRIGQMARAMMNGKIDKILLEFDRKGSLPTTHTSQGSDMGLCSGVLGFEPDDKRMVSYESQMKEAGIKIDYKTDDFGDIHPNTYRLTLSNQYEELSFIALSIGGGMVEIIKIDDFNLSIKGDCFETLIYWQGERDQIESKLNSEALVFNNYALGSEKKGLIRIKSLSQLPQAILQNLDKISSVQKICTIYPVLPILTPESMEIPFENATQLLAYNKGKGFNLADLALEYESKRGGIYKDHVLEKMIHIIKIMKGSIKEGLHGTAYKDRILGQQSDKYIASLEKGDLMDLGALNQIILYVSALMETKSAMGVIVAAPTAGSCGGLPGAIIAMADAMKLDETAMAKALLAAGMVGVFIAKETTFAAEVGGCQAECGAGSGMAAAGLVTLLGGNLQKALTAAAMALQNSFGMVCDPVANRVEVPCLGKNIMGASNAVSCANMALAGYDPVIPLDEVIQAMDKVGKSIHSNLRCTGFGGLSITHASKAMEEKLSDL